jgi:hypothetical protein
MGQRGFFSLYIPVYLAELPKARLLMEEIGQQAALPVERKAVTCRVCPLALCQWEALT